ncbi:hypothetical protein FPANT_436 [Fusarium pseudoanthophilum]|uniref:Uncharacterized protein n=1 Tax=Fusarium pseudoanthophilum TaxID=48495 RepID=A0A8H5Q741_9HYPO|nr:hypothetical protein FPANT_436 [Fusarium pseudoanthophilum]
MEEIRERLRENRQQLQGYRNNEGNDGRRIRPLTKNPGVEEVITAAKKKVDGGATAKSEDQRKGAEVEGHPMKCIGHARPDTGAAPTCETQLWSVEWGSMW